MKNIFLKNWQNANLYFSFRDKFEMAQKSGKEILKIFFILLLTPKGIH